MSFHVVRVQIHLDRTRTSTNITSYSDKSYVVPYSTSTNILHCPVQYKGKSL